MNLIIEHVGRYYELGNREFIDSGLVGVGSNVAASSLVGDTSCGWRSGCYGRHLVTNGVGEWLTEASTVLNLARTRGVMSMRIGMWS